MTDKEMLMMVAQAHETKRDVDRVGPIREERDERGYTKLEREDMERARQRLPSLERYVNRRR